jgi:hypothetical protein
MRPAWPIPRAARRRGPIAAAILGAAVALPAAGLGATSTTSPDTLPAGAALASGQAVRSADGHYALVMQSTGNLVDETAGGRVLWSSGTAGSDGAHALLQSNGNLVIESAAGAVLYSTNSHSAGCPRLVLQDDGNAVIYGASQPAWADGVIQTTLWPGDELQPGWSIHAKPETVRLRMRSDGDLVLVDADEHVLWDSHTSGHPGARVLMQDDGNLVVSGTDGRALWSSNTTGHPGAHLTLLSNGNLVLAESNGSVVWSTQTAGRASVGSMAPSAPSPVACPSSTSTTQPATTPAGTPTPGPPSEPVSPAPVTTPVPTPAPVTHGLRALRIRMAIGWTWDRSVTRVGRVRVGTAPGRVRLSLTCRGRGCPRHRRPARGVGLRALHRLLARLAGRRFGAGEGLLVSLSAPGYRAERILISFRWGRLPQVRLLGPR